MKKDLSIFFSPLDLQDLLEGQPGKNTLGSLTNFHSEKKGFPSLKDIDLAIVGVEEGRSGNGSDVANAPDIIRKWLYRLYRHSSGVQMADLGNIKPGKTVEDTYFALSTTVIELVKQEVVPIIIGGSHDLTYANYAAYEDLERTVNMIGVDPALDLGDPESGVNATNFLSKVLIHRPNYLFNYAHVGYQSYFVDEEMLDVLEQLRFDTYRLGELREDMKECEPIVRDADILSFDLSAIRASDAPGVAKPSPNGLFGDEACQICRYAGMSERMSSVGFYDMAPGKDQGERTAHLVAQMVWYFIEGYYDRRHDLPVGDRSGFTKYTVDLEGSGHEIVFYRSVKSDRWWMDVPYPPDDKLKYQRRYLAPCSYEDYVMATKDEVPERWWRMYNKLS